MKLTTLLAALGSVAALVVAVPAPVDEAINNGKANAVREADPAWPTVGSCRFGTVPDTAAWPPVCESGRPVAASEVDEVKGNAVREAEPAWPPVDSCGDNYVLNTAAWPPVCEPAQVDAIDKAGNDNDNDNVNVNVTTSTFQGITDELVESRFGTTLKCLLGDDKALCPKRRGDALNPPSSIALAATPTPTATAAVLTNRDAAYDPCTLCDKMWDLCHVRAKRTDCLDNMCDTNPKKLPWVCMKGRECAFKYCSHWP